MQAITIAVVGSGFAGSYFLRELKKLRGKLKRPVRVLLFEPNDCFIFTPLLPEVATASLDMEHVRVHLDRLFPEEWIQHIKERVTRVDLDGKRVQTSARSYAYDYVVIATGARPNYFGKKELAKHTLTLKTGDDAHRLRYALEQAIIDAATTESEQERLLTVSIVGGGPTGVELAGETIQFLTERLTHHSINARPTVRLIQGAPVLLPMASPRTQRYAEKALTALGVTVITKTLVHAVNENEVLCTQGGKELRLATNLTVWVAGVTPAPPRVDDLHGTDDLRGAVPIRRTLQVVGHDDAYAIGDVAQYDPLYSQERLPALAQVATQVGPFAARNLVRHVNKQPLESYEWRSKGFLVSLGQKDAAAELVTPLGKVFLRGFVAWWLWRTIYLIKFLDAKQRWKNIIDWTVGLFTGRRFAQERV